MLSESREMQKLFCQTLGSVKVAIKSSPAEFGKEPNSPIIGLGISFQ